jgi:immune inhibitor A
MINHKHSVCKHGHGGTVAVWSDFCAVAPSPELKERMKADLADARKRSKSPLADVFGMAKRPRHLGFDDGVIVPPEQFPVGTPFSTIRGAAAERAPLRGTTRVIVVLVQFSDKAMTASVAHFNDLFFSTGVLPHGSVKEYYDEVTGGLIDIVGEVVGPYQLPQTLAWYANNNFGIGRPSGTARANIMARDAAVAANPDVNFALYDNDGNGLVDAFIVVHAGQGGEQTGNSNDIWSHKWTLPSALSADGKQIFAYLTIPEDARIGVCAHELGHLLFGFPDLYDIDDTSEGIGNWCLMGGGSWNGGGDVPAHPSAWCKTQQGWTTVTNVTSSSTLSIPDVKTSRTVHRLWKDGAGGQEYFLLENRQRTGYDQGLPGDGLLIWHIDEAQAENSDENHYKVALMQADAKRDLELANNRGDAGDPYPGSSGNTSFSAGSTPNSKSYAGQNTCVSVITTSPSGTVMTVTVAVRCGPTKSTAKDRKDLKDRIKEGKELFKDRKDLKDRFEGKFPDKGFRETAGGKGPREIAEGAGGGGVGYGETVPDMTQAVVELEARVRALEALAGLDGNVEPFIGSELRPDLVGGPDYTGRGDLQERMAAGDRDAKIAFDTMPSP